MSCREDLLASLLAGELEGPERAEMDAHLLACEPCWQAVREDRAGRAALARLREPAPVGLADRITLGVELAGGSTSAPGRARRSAGRRPARRRPLASHRRPLLASHRRPLLASHRRPLLAGLALVLALAGLVAGLATALQPGNVAPGEATVVAAVARMAAAHSGAPVRLADSHGSEQMRIGGRPLTVRAFHVDGVLTVVVIASAPFGEPAAPAAAPGSSTKAWMASTGGVGLYCLNAPAGRHSMLVAARMPAVELPGVLSALHLGTT